VRGVQVTGGVPQRLACVAPQYSEPVHATPPLAGVHVIVPPQPSAIVPHLPAQDAGWHAGSGPHRLGPPRPQASSAAQPPQSMVLPQPSGCAPQLLCPPPPGHACAKVFGVQGGAVHVPSTHSSPRLLSHVSPPLLALQV
jgi:hypothetical protein